MDPAVVSTVRRFNRSHARRAGTLADSFLATGRAYGPARLLFEIGTAGATTLELRARLGLDSGYLSRMLRQLETDSLVSTSPDPADGRRRLVRLTADGRRAWADLDARSDALAAELLDGLTEPQQQRLAAALDTADRLLTVSGVRFDVVDPRSPAAVEAMTTYFLELDRRFAAGFHAGDTLVADAPAMTSPTGSFVIATIDDRIVACGGVQQHDESTGEIKRMWVNRAWRGVGLGRRTLERLEVEVASLGYTRVVLDTNDTLTEAIAMYERAGYHPIERYNDNPDAMCWFAKRLG